MIRHISIFYGKESATAEQLGTVEKALLELRKELTGIADYQVGRNCANLPPAGTKSAPDFGTLVQVIDFMGEKEADAYPQHPAHRKFIEETAALIEKVAAIDFVLQEGEGI